MLLDVLKYIAFTPYLSGKHTVNSLVLEDLVWKIQKTSFLVAYYSNRYKDTAEHSNLRSKNKGIVKA